MSSRKGIVIMFRIEECSEMSATRDRCGTDGAGNDNLTMTDGTSLKEGYLSIEVPSVGVKKV